MDSVEVLPGKYKKLEKIGSGSFGEIFNGIDLETNEKVAIKTEPIDAKVPQLLTEARLYQFLNTDPVASDKGIPKVYYAGQADQSNFLVMDLLGPSLEQLFQKCKQKFSLKTVLLLADQMITQLEFLHGKLFLHRDIKPDNYLIGVGRKAHKVFMIDFGLAKRYASRDQKHIPYREGKELTGTARYASINSHLGVELSRRDDLESLAYVLLYFAKGSLPWQNLKFTTKEEKYEKILQRKISTKVEMVSEGCPEEFGAFLSYAKSLKFDEKPDYSYCKGIFQKLFESEKYEHDFEYDWTSERSKSPSKSTISKGKTPNGVDGEEEKGKSQPIIFKPASGLFFPSSSANLFSFGGAKPSSSFMGVLPFSQSPSGLPQGAKTQAQSCTSSLFAKSTPDFSPFLVNQSPNPLQESSIEGHSPKIGAFDLFEPTIPNQPPPHSNNHTSLGNHPSLFIRSLRNNQSLFSPVLSPDPVKLKQNDEIKPVLFLTPSISIENEMKRNHSKTGLARQAHQDANGNDQKALEFHLGDSEALKPNETGQDPFSIQRGNEENKGENESPPESFSKMGLGNGLFPPTNAKNGAFSFGVLPKIN